MDKRTNTYCLSLEQLSLAKEGAEMQPPIIFEFDNHDEIFRIIEIIKEKDPFDNTNQATEFALGLKMLSEVMIKNRNHPLFEDFAKEMQSFIKKVKALK